MLIINGLNVESLGFQQQFRYKDTVLSRKLTSFHPFSSWEIYFSTTIPHAR
jgi:hypothetical protein